MDKNQDRKGNLIFPREEQLTVLEKIQYMITMFDDRRIVDWAEFGARVYMLHDEIDAMVQVLNLADRATKMELILKMEQILC